jgi:hypothetical protein
MKTYFLNISEEEKKSITEKHRELYNGYQTLQPENKMSPLNVENLAQDDKGATLNNKFEVTEYKNKGINKPMMTQCNECGNMVNEGDVCECSGYKMEEKQMCDECGSPMNEDNVCECGERGMKYSEEEIKESIKVKSKADKVYEQINESLDWFRRFKKY